MENSTADLLKGLDIASSKIEEIAKKPQVVQNINTIRECSPVFTKMHYSLACTAPRNADLRKICLLIDRRLVRHESMLRGVYKYLESPTGDSIEEFIRKNDHSRDEIERCVVSRLPGSRGDVLRGVKREMPYADFRVVMDILDARFEGTGGAVPAEAPCDSRYGWLDEGEISKVARPENNRQAHEQILANHLKRTGGIVVTRFPPEPNGLLHIGHAKAINISFQYAEKYGGITYLRFDDTNPRNEREEHYRAILEDVEWLGFKPYAVTASSDYNDKMNEMSKVLIRKNKAYVCHCTLDDIRNRRQVFQRERDAGNTDPTILSPYRNRSVDENLAVFEGMLRGEYGDGEAVLRFKMDLDSRNQFMLDLIGSRVINAVHPGKGRNWFVYPTYEFALCVADSLEDVTHSFCSREFMTRQEPYHWLLRTLGLYEPVQWEFSRLNLSNTVLSKRKMKAIVERGIEWDDPRLYTICGMRRRGFPPAAVNRFVTSVGITYSEAVVDVRILENFVRSELNATAERVFCIRNPVKLVVSNLARRKVNIAGMGRESDGPAVTVDVNKIVYIDGSDFSEDPPADFHRLTRSQPVGLIGIGTVKFVDRTADAITCELCEEKPLKHIQWVPSLCNKVALRIYKPLFRSFNPDAASYLDDIDMDSVETVDGFCDSRVVGSKALDRFQFVRMGFFCCDRTSKDGSLVFNLTLPLRRLY